MRRRTEQRTAILRALQRADRPLSPQEILTAARKQVRTLGLATVYRNLKTLIAEGALRPVELPGAPSRYETAGRDHHHHFHCRSCDAVYEVEDCPGELKDLAPSGFRAEHHEIILYGLCRTCLEGG